MKNKKDTLTTSLLDSAEDVLYVLCQLREAEGADQPFELSQDELIKHLDNFKAQAKKYYVTSEHIRKAHYILCVALDEAYYYANRNFTTKFSNLLSICHHDSEGGAKFFSYLESFLEYPEANIELLQLCLLCLGLGFKGKYALANSGSEILLNKRKQLLSVIGEHQQLTSQARELSIDKNKQQIKSYRRSLLKPLTIGVVILVVTFLGLNAVLSAKVGSLRSTVEQIDAQPHLQFNNGEGL